MKRLPFFNFSYKSLEDVSFATYFLNGIVEKYFNFTVEPLNQLQFNSVEQNYYKNLAFSPNQIYKNFNNLTSLSIITLL